MPDPSSSHVGDPTVDLERSAAFPWSTPSYQRHCCETGGCHSIQDIQGVNRSRRPGAPRSKCAEPSHPGIQAPTTNPDKSANLGRRADHASTVSSASGWSHDFNPSTEPSELPRPSGSTHFPPVWRYTPPGPHDQPQKKCESETSGGTCSDDFPGRWRVGRLHGTSGDLRYVLAVRVHVIHVRPWSHLHPGTRNDTKMRAKIRR